MTRIPAISKTISTDALLRARARGRVPRPGTAMRERATSFSRDLRDLAPSHLHARDTHTQIHDDTTGPECGDCMLFGGYFDIETPRDSAVILIIPAVTYCTHAGLSSVRQRGQRNSDPRVRTVAAVILWCAYI